jgi:poly-gamma-glutamate capsule biosynthesis protein CapA/YwtB (metallophosphatase superfamily)
VSSLLFKCVVVLVAPLAVGCVAADGATETSMGVPQPSTTSTGTPSTTTTIPPPSPTTSATLPPRGTLVIHGTGDVNLDPEYIPALAANGWDHAWAGLDGLFQDDDLTVVNLECAPSDIGQPEPKEFVFRCPAASLPSLATAGVEVASMGNNHSGDYGKEALVDGRANLIASGVAPVGAGANAAEAGAPALFEIAGWRVAVVGFGGVFPNPPWFATADRPGMRDGDDIPSMVEAVQAAAEVADIVVVAIHWGVEFDTEPRTEDIERAEAMIDAGADVIFGHHAHRLQPFEMVNDSAVFWGLGNFVWPRQSTAGSTTGVARAVVHPDGTIEACLIPAFIESPGQPVLTGEPECGPER